MSPQRPLAPPVHIHIGLLQVDPEVCDPRSLPGDLDTRLRASLEARLGAVAPSAPDRNRSWIDAVAEQIAERIRTGAEDRR